MFTGRNSLVVLPCPILPYVPSPQINSSPEVVSKPECIFPASNLRMVL
jgi:hypothetical protein